MTLRQWNKKSSLLQGRDQTYWTPETSGYIYWSCSFHLASCSIIHLIHSIPLDFTLFLCYSAFLFINLLRSLRVFFLSFFSDEWPWCCWLTEMSAGEKVRERCPVLWAGTGDVNKTVTALAELGSGFIKRERGAFRALMETYRGTTLWTHIR